MIKAKATNFSRPRPRIFEAKARIYVLDVEVYAA